jgi:hypothetical protein
MSGASGEERAIGKNNHSYGSYLMGTDNIRRRLMIEGWNSGW